MSEIHAHDNFSLTFTYQMNDGKKISSIVIYANSVDGSNLSSGWSSESSALIWSGTPSTTVTLSGSYLDVQGVSSVVISFGGEISVHSHSFSYSATGATITAHCGNTGCPLTSDPTLTISAPDNLIYNDEAKTATLNHYVSSVFPGQYTIKYYQGETLLDGAPVNVGSYTAKVTAEGQTASVDFDIEGRTPIRYMTQTKLNNNWLIEVHTIVQYLLMASKSDSYYQMYDGRTYVVKGNVTLEKGLAYEGSVNILVCSGSTLIIR